MAISATTVKELIPELLLIFHSNYSNQDLCHLNDGDKAAVLMFCVERTGKREILLFSSV